MKNGFTLIIVIFFIGFIVPSCSDNDESEGVKKLLIEANISSTGPGTYLFEYDEQNRMKEFLWIDIFQGEDDIIREIMQKHVLDYNSKGKLSRYSIYRNLNPGYLLDYYSDFRYNGDTVFSNNYNYLGSNYKLLSSDTLIVNNKGFLIKKYSHDNYILYSYDSEDNLMKKEYYDINAVSDDLYRTTLYEYDSNKSIFTNQNITPWFWAWNRYQHLRYFTISMGKNNAIKEYEKINGYDIVNFEIEFIIGSDGYPTTYAYKGDEPKQNAFKYTTIR